MTLRGYWLSSWNFFRVGKIYYYANPFCYVIVFGPNFKEGKIVSGVPPLEESQVIVVLRMYLIMLIFFHFLVYLKYT